jgi:hypothetical protein
MQLSRGPDNEMWGATEVAMPKAMMNDKLWRRDTRSWSPTSFCHLFLLP